MNPAGEITGRAESPLSASLRTHGQPGTVGPVKRKPREAVRGVLCTVSRNYGNDFSTSVISDGSARLR